MAQPFLTYEQQIRKLSEDKNLIITDHHYAEETLKQIGYFALISGYKDLFKNPTTKKYKDNTKFEDIVALYKFDENLRELFLKYLLKIERNLRSLISYYFTEKHGELQSGYLDANNFTPYPKYKPDVSRLIGELDKLANESSDYHYINYHRNTYKNVPLWVLTNGITFGTLSKFYQLMPQELQCKVSKNFPSITEIELQKILNVITKFRNVCAHNERLFSYKTKNDIPNFDCHKNLNIAKKGNVYKYGKHDLFAVVISFKYLLKDDDFEKFENSFTNTLNHYLNESHAIPLNKILSAMGFPLNWNKINK